MLTSMAKSVRIVEVGPRDGLQNESIVLSTDDKVEFINLLLKSGLTTIETTSFVRADKIPQMADSHELYTKLTKTNNDISYPCLVPNLKGLELAINAGVSEIAIFTSISETFNKKNINRTIEQSLHDIEDIVTKANSEKIKIRAYISTAFGCPYEGNMSVEKLIKMTETLQNFGAYDISIGDTIGVAAPTQVVKFLTSVKKHCDLNKLSMHFHDTEGRALSNILTSFELGVTSFDTSAGGLGGCPFAKGATGNVATEDVVSFFEAMGVSTGVNMEVLSEASQFILEKLNKHTTSKYLQSYLAKKK
jgi:hydroxymethylglutaryl-CoA lyase